MVCIIDDREDVWKFAPNLITVKKYVYFQGTGDINAPPGSREAQTERKGKAAARAGQLMRSVLLSRREAPADLRVRGGRRFTASVNKPGTEAVSSPPPSAPARLNSCQSLPVVVLVSGAGNELLASSRRVSSGQHPLSKLTPALRMRHPLLITLAVRALPVLAAHIFIKANME